MMVTFSDPCDFNQLNLGLCQLTKSLNKNACLLLLFSPSVNSHLFVTPRISAHQAFLSFIISLSLFKLKSIKSMMPSSHLILCHPLLLLFSTSGSFPVSHFFISGGQSIRASTLASVFSMNIQGWFPLGLTSLVSLLFKRLSRVFFSTTVQKHQFFGAQPCSTLTSIHDYQKNHNFDYIDLCWQSDVSTF